MTPSIRPAGRDAGSCIDDDLHELADQLKRCIGSQGRWFRLHAWLTRGRTFAAAHITSVTAAAALACGLYWLAR